MTIFLGRPIKSNQELSVHAQMILKFSGLFKREINIKFLLASLKTLSNSKNGPKTASNFCFGFPLLSLVDFLTCTLMAGFRKSFQNHRKLSESQTKLPEEDYGNGFHKY
jgi:hypothetical protein